MDGSIGIAAGLSGAVEHTFGETPAASSRASKELPNLLQAQLELSEIALEGASVEVVLDRAIAIAIEILGPDWSGVAIVTEETARPHVSRGGAFPVEKLENEQWLREAAGAWHRPATAAEAVEHEGRARILETDGAATLWGEPIGHQADGFRGALLVQSSGGAGGAALTISALAKSIELALRISGRVRTSRSADETLASLTAAIPGVVYQRVVQPTGEIYYTYISESSREFFGVSPQEILADSRALFQHYSPDYRESFHKRLVDASRELTIWDVEASVMMPNGEQKFTHAIARPARQEDGSVVWTGVILDATRIKEAEAALAAAEARTRTAIVESLSQGLLMFDVNDRLTVFNSHYLLLYPELKELIEIGLSYDELVSAEAGPEVLPMVDERQRDDDLEQRISNHRAAHQVFERKLTRERSILVNEHKMADGGTVVLYTDITDLKLREKRIHHIAHHDQLTDLPNRVMFRDRLEEALGRARRSGHPVAVFCLDLDHFKNINDTLGHPAGDALLKIVSNRLLGCLRAEDTAARLGGDEFAVIVPDLPTPEFATSLATRMLEAICQPADIDGQQVLTAASVGIVVSTPGEIDTAKLIKSADLALYRAKAEGRSTFRYFEAEMDIQAQARRALEIDLRMALARNEMVLNYQPVVDVYTNEIVAFEALVRWQHPRHGSVPPLEFIGLAEETGLIRPLGEWILRTACETAATWPEQVRIAINLSPAQFKDRELADTIFRILEETHLDPHRLELEITESLLLRDTEANLTTLHRLKAAGIRISMDDFGTGYSSLGNLRSFPFDKIKIDQSFVKDLERNPDSASIVRAVLSLGRSLGMGTIAEGVETREQLSRLRAEGCTEMQGFYYSTPQPAEGVERMLGQGLQCPGPKIHTRENTTVLRKDVKAIELRRSE